MATVGNLYLERTGIYLITEILDDTIVCIRLQRGLWARNTIQSPDCGMRIYYINLKVNLVLPSAIIVEDFK